MDHFVIEIGDDGNPLQLIGPGTLVQCQEYAAQCARENDVSEDRIREEILGSANPGCCYDPENSSLAVHVMPAQAFVRDG
jgi:hypothetical protein